MVPAPAAGEPNVRPDDFTPIIGRLGAHYGCKIAKETERPKSFHVQKALEAYLSEIADLQVAYDRLHDTTDPVISIEDMRKKLEL